jgi:HEAT repeat protein
VGVILVLAVAAESMVATQLRGNVIGWLRGEPYRKDLRKRLALQELKLELQSASQLPGPGAGMVAGMNVHARIKALARLGRDAVPDLVAMLSDGDPDTRRAAVITLAGMAPVAAEGPRAVTDALRDNQHTDVRWEAADALGTMVPRSRQAVAALVRALEEDKDASVRWKAAEALGKVLNELDRRPDVVEALGGIGPEVEAAVTALANALRNEGDGQARWKAAEALAGIGPAAKSAGPALLEALKEGKVDRGTAGGVLKRIDPEAAKKAGFK